MQRVPLRERDHSVDERLHGLRLGYGRDHAFFLDHTRRQILEQAVAGPDVPLQLCIAKPMSHANWSSSGSSSMIEPGGGGGGAMRRPCASGFMPSDSPIVWRISLISLSDLRPKFLVRNISDSD